MLLLGNFFILYYRCCDYALLILEYWADAPEIQRSADLYEDLIRCCVADAMSEVFTSRIHILFFMTCFEISCFRIHM